jgi:hypothetical protein
MGAMPQQQQQPQQQPQQQQQQPQQQPQQQHRPQQGSLMARVASMEQVLGIEPASILMARIQELERQCGVDGFGGMQGRVVELERLLLAPSCTTRERVLRGCCWGQKGRRWARGHGALIQIADWSVDWGAGRGYARLEVACRGRVV